MTNMSTDLTKYETPKHVTIPLPEKLGSVHVQPLASKSIKVWSDQLLIGSAVYTFDSHMQKVDDRWYFVNRAEIGVTGGRPTPKQTTTTLESIAGAVNEALLGEEVFQQQLQEIREKEEQRELELNERQEVKAYKSLQRNLRDTLVRLMRRRDEIADLDRQLIDWQQQLSKFEEEHPNISTLMEKYELTAGN